MSQVMTSSLSSRTEQGHRLELHTSPASLPEAKLLELIDAFVDLSARTTGGEDWRSYRPALDGWRQYYSSPGARPQDYDRLVLIYDEDLLIHFTGVIQLMLAPSRPLVFIRSAMTLREYHGAGLLKSAILAVFSPRWLQELAGSSEEVFFALRTANPIVYEATRNLVADYAPNPFLEFTMFPQISDGGGLAPMPDEIRAIAQRTVEMTSPGCQFLPETFVNKGYYKMYGALYKEPVFPCRNPVTQEYFNRVVDYSNQDGIIMLIRMRRRQPDAPASTLGGETHGTGQ
jgi:hypothetical protein